MASIHDTKAIDKLVERIREGNYLYVSANSVGIPSPTLTYWLRRGQEEEDGPYHDFYEKVQRANADIEVEMVSRLKQAAEDNWKANIEFLQRRFGDRWSRNDRARIAVEEDATPADVRELLSDPNVRQGLNDIFKKIAELNAGQTVEGDYRELES